MNFDRFEESSLESLRKGISVPVDSLDDLKSPFEDATGGGGFGAAHSYKWEYFKKEMIHFVCGPAKDEMDRHAELREHLGAGSTATETAVIGTVAAFVGTHIGSNAEILAPFVAIAISIAKRRCLFLLRFVSSA